MTAGNGASAMIRVAYVTSLLDKMGGAEKNLCDVVLNIDRKRFQPFVLAFVGGEVSRSLSEKGIPVEVNGVSKLLSGEAAAKGKKFMRFLRRNRMDVVVTYHHDADIWGGVFSRLAGVPVVISSRRDMGYQLERKHIHFYRYCQGLFSSFITVSHAVGRTVSERERIPGRKITVIHNGIDLNGVGCEDTDTAGLREKYGIARESFVIGTVGSFRPIKGQAYLADAARVIIERGHRIHVVMVGDDTTEYALEVKKRIARWGGEPYFTFTGEQKNVWPFLSLSDVFVLPSETEGFSNALVEAMACGKPVVAAETGGNPEIVRHGETGLLFAPRDVESLVRDVLQILTDESLRGALAGNARRAIEEGFTLDAMVRKHELLYETLLEKR